MFLWCSCVSIKNLQKKFILHAVKVFVCKTKMANCIIFHLFVVLLILFFKVYFEVHCAVQMSVRWAVRGCNLFPLAVLPEYFKRGNKLSNNKQKKTFVDFYFLLQFLQRLFSARGFFSLADHQYDI